MVFGVLGVGIAPPTLWSSHDAEGHLVGPCQDRNRGLQLDRSATSAARPADSAGRSIVISSDGPAGQGSLRDSALLRVLAKPSASP